MKKIFLLSALLGTTASLCFSQEVKVNAQLKLKDPAEMAFLSFRDGDKSVRDSARIIDGKANFKLNLSGPTYSTFTVRFKKEAGEEWAKSDRFNLFLEPGTITITAKDSLELATVKGSKTNEDLKKLQKLEAPFDAQEKSMGELFAQYRKDNDEAGMKKIREDYQKMSKTKSDQVYKVFVQANPASPVSLYALGLYAGYDLDPTIVEPLFSSLSAPIKDSKGGQAFKGRIETAKKTSVGAMAMDFIQNDTLGHPIALSSFKGKYVLLDFWASWCGPCRAENPNVVKAFNKYKDNNFTVLSVSLDQPGKKQSWLDAIHKDGLTWTHVSDLKFWENAAAKEYGIRGIPANFLIDPTGKIIAKDLRGEVLEKKLAEVLPKS